jgi:hypothetical protein
MVEEDVQKCLNLILAITGDIAYAKGEQHACLEHKELESCRHCIHFADEIAERAKDLGNLGCIHPKMKDMTIEFAKAIKWLCGLPYFETWATLSPERATSAAKELGYGLLDYPDEEEMRRRAGQKGALPKVWGDMLVTLAKRPSGKGIFTFATSPKETRQAEDHPGKNRPRFRSWPEDLEKHL